MTQFVRTQLVRWLLFFTASLLGPGFLTGALAQFTQGNIVVLQTGDGSAALTGAATPVFLKQFTPTGTLVNTLALPTTVSGGNARLTQSGTAGSEGALTLSADGRYLTLVGYDAAPGTASIAGTASSTTNRIVGRIDNAGTINTTTKLTAAYSANNIRAAVTNDGIQFWTAGPSTGLGYTTLGSSAVTQISSLNSRVVSISNGQLYVSSGSAPNVGINSVGTGLPTTAQTPALLAASSNSYGFVLLDRDPTVAGVDVLYIADQTSGILKYSYNGTTWSAQGSLTGTATGLTGVVNVSNTVDLYVTVGTGAGNTLYKVTDAASYNTNISGTGTIIANGTLLATAPANTAFRGVAFAPAIPQPDLTLALSAPASATTNQPFNYSLVVSNPGSASASGIAVNFSLPASTSVTYNSAVGASNFTVDGPQSGTLVSFSSGTLAAGASTTLTVNVTPTVTSNITSGTALVDPANAIAESNETNNSANGVTVSVNAPPAGIIRITEFMYSGSPGEFTELTNVGNAPIDLTGWTFNDNITNDTPNPIGAFGIVQPGESVIYTEADPATFRKAWFLPTSVKVVGPYTTNKLGRTGEINIFDGTGALVQKLVYGDQAPGPGGFRTQDISAWPTLANLNSLSANTWTGSTVGDAQTSYSATTGNIGNPGGYNVPLKRVLVYETPTPNGTTTITEGGASDTYTVSLNTAPTADVTITITGPGTPVTVSPTPLVFTSANFATAQTVTVSAINDGIGQGNRTVTITQAATSSDAAYNSITVNPLSVSVVDGPTANPISISAINNGPYLETSTTGPAYISGVIADPTDPASTSGVNFSLSAATNLTVTASSSNQAVVTDASLVLTGTGAARNLKIMPVGVGYATVSVTAANGTASSVYVINYAASAASTSTSRFHTGRSDASTAQDAGGGYMFVGDDESNVLRLYNRTQSGLPVYTFDAGPLLNLTDISGGVPREVDIEASAKNGNTIYWFGSQSNSEAGNLRTNRNRVFTTDVTGSGASATLAYVGRYDFLREDLIAWDVNNTHTKGANYYGLAASAANGVNSKAPDGYNIEGAEFAPDNSTLYIGFRAPQVPLPGRTKALVVPVTNLTTLMAASGGGTQGSATFGAPIEMDLGGRGIREIKKNSNNEYLIVAGPAGSNGAAPNDFRLYTWTGVATDAPVLRAGDVSGLSGSAEGSSIESIVEVPSPITPTSSVQFVMDNGDLVFYNDGTIAKDLTQNNFKKSRSDYATVGAALAPTLVANPTTLGNFTALTGAASAPQVYTLTGTNLTASASVSVSAGYEISTDGAIYSTTATVPQTTGAISQTIAVRLASSMTAGPVSGTVTNTSGSATATVTLSGSVSAPVVTGSPGKIVVSQVYGGGGNGGATYQNDYVELFNAGGTAIDVSNYSIQYASATGTGNFSSNTVSLTGTIGAGQYYLVKLASNAAVGLPLPNADMTGGIAMAAGAGKVIVANTTVGLACNGGSTTCSAAQTAQIVDLVGYGNANYFEGTAAAPTISATLADFRLLNGCTDTDNNGADFTTGTPNPRNSASPVNLCTPSTTPFITATPSPVSLSYTVGGGPASQVVTVNAGNLTPAAGNVTVSSSSTAVTVNPALLAYTGGSLSGATFTAQLVAGLGVGTYPATLTLTNGTTSTTLVVNGTVKPVAGAIVFIHDIQGTGTAAALTGTQTIEGIVTRTFATTAGLNGFYIQEEDADSDNNPATSEGIFVYDPGVYFTGASGDKVRLTGVVTEFATSAKGNNSSLTEITLSSAANLTVVSNSNPLPAIVTVTLPVANVSDLEKYEGMLVTMSAASGNLTVTEYFELGRYGQVLLSADAPTNIAGTDPRLDQYTQFYAPSVTGYAAYLAEIDKRSIYLDDGRSQQNVDPIIFGRGGQPLSASSTLRGGDGVPSITAVLDERAEGYRLQTNTGVNFQPTNPRPTTGPAVGGTLKTGNLNVLNYFNTFGTANFTNCAGNAIGGRGADNSQELTRQRTKIVQNIITSGLDVMGINEMQNNGYGANSAIQDLINGLNAATAPGTYTFVNAGCISTDAITVAMLYKPAKVALVGASATTNTASFQRVGRQPLAQTFREIATGGVFTLVSNHWKSKGSSSGAAGDTDINDGQSASNGTRTEQARDLLAWLATKPTGTTDPDYLIVGDLNAYAKEDPLTTLENGGYTNLVPNTTYSYVFDGFVGALDHALRSGSLQTQVAGADKYHINADEPSVLDYNTDFKSAGQIASLYAPDQYRSSDHDPVVVGLNLTPSLSATLVASTSVCVGSPANFSLTVAGLGTNDTYSYTITNGTNSTTASGVSASAVQTSVVTTVAGSFTATVLTSTNASTTAASGNVTINALPTNASLTSGTLTCIATSVTLTASATGGASYTLNGGPTSQTNTTGQFVVSTAGNYTAIIANASGCMATATAMVISNTATPTATLTSSGTLTCAQTSVTLTAGGGMSYTFSAGAMQIGSTNQAVVTIGGVYSVTVANASGCTSTTTTTVASDTAAPTNVSLTSGTLTCATTSVTLTASSTGGTSYTLSDGQTSTTGQFVVSTAGNYTVTASGPNGCTASAMGTVTSSTATPMASLSASSTTACSPASITLTAGGGTSYTFSAGAAQVGNSNQAIVTQSGSYTVTVINASGCTATASTSVTVNTPPTAPTLTGVSRTVTQSTTPLPLTQFVNATGGNTLSFSGVNGMLNPPNADISQPGVLSFSVTQTNTSGCVSPATPFTITVQQSATTSPGSQTVCRSSAVVLSATTTGVRYEWYKNGTSAPFKLTEIASIQKGTATSSLTLVSIQTTASYYVKVFQANGSFVFDGPFIVTVNYGCTAPGARLAASEIAEAEVPLSVTLTPNPVVDGQLRAVVRGAGNQPLTVKLLDLRGQVVREQAWPVADTEQTIEWSIGTNATGLYLLQAQIPGRLTTVKVIKQ